MSKKLIIVLTMVGIIGLGTYAFAHWGGGYGNQGWMHGGPGMHHGYFSGPGYGYPSDLKEEEFKSLEKERAAFIKQTEKLRQSLYSKELELSSELLKENPDAGKAAGLQKEISDLEAKLDQKRIEHMINVRKINPNVGRGSAGMGYMMGYGYQNQGACW